MNDAKELPNSHLPERIITPHAGFDAFTDAFASIVRDIRQSRELGWRMFARDTKAMYRQSLLGYVWLFLPPLATAIIWIFLNDQSLVSIETGDAPVPIFILSGTVLWTAFNMSFVGMQAIMSEARSVLSKVSFPHEALVISAIIKALFNTTLPALILIPSVVIYDVTYRWDMLLFPIGFLTLILLGCGFGLLLVPIAALYSDVGRAVQLGLRFGFFVTPVIYALPASGPTRMLLLCNPVAAPLVSSRHWLIGGESSLWLGTLMIMFVSFFVLGFATIIFKVTMPHIIERMNV